MSAMVKKTILLRENISEFFWPKESTPVEIKLMKRLSSLQCNFESESEGILRGEIVPNSLLT